jgi:hypothetical protein
VQGLHSQHTPGPITGAELPSGLRLGTSRCSETPNLTTFTLKPLVFEPKYVFWGPNRRQLHPGAHRAPMTATQCVGGLCAAQPRLSHPLILPKTSSKLTQHRQIRAHFGRREAILTILAVVRRNWLCIKSRKSRYSQKSAPKSGVFVVSFFAKIAQQPQKLMR